MGGTLGTEGSVGVCERTGFPRMRGGLVMQGGLGAVLTAEDAGAYDED